MDLDKLESQIKSKELPSHVAIIMDGNGRWAKRRNLPRIFGHKVGMSSIREITKVAASLKIKYLSLFAFSTENWNRPKSEINGLFKLLRHYIKVETKNIMKNNIKLMVSGDISELDKDAKEGLKNLIELSKQNTGMVLNLCINYSGRQEIIRAINNIIRDNLNKVDSEVFGRYLYTNGLPDPDLLIRTSGELRISNFFLWQIAYTEFFFTDVLWPDFRKKEFYQAIISYQRRVRRYGSV